MSDAITYNHFFQAAADGLTLGPDRHPKWQRVEPGQHVPADQPYRVEPKDEGQSIREWRRGSGSDWIANPANDSYSYFIDSSWKPPLVLPTEPTWGIAIHTNYGPMIGRWYLDTGEDFWREGQGSFRGHNIIDFIELTPEQVQRIEAAK